MFPLRSVVEEKFGIATNSLYRTIGYIARWPPERYAVGADDVLRLPATVRRLAAIGRSSAISSTTLELRASNAPVRSKEERWPNRS